MSESDGYVTGDECPECGTSLGLNFEGTFTEGDELTCPHCGTTSIVAEMAVTCNVVMQTVEEG